MSCPGFSEDSANLNSVAAAFLSVIPAGNLLLVSGAYEKRIPCGNDRKKGKGPAAIKSIGWAPCFSASRGSISATEATP